MEVDSIMTKRHDISRETRPHNQLISELATHSRPIALALSGAAALVAILPELDRGAPWIAAAGLGGLAMAAGIVWLSETESGI